MHVNEELLKYEAEQDRNERIAHRDALLAVASIVKSDQGRKLFKYLFKSFDVGTVAEKGLDGMDLHDRLGFLRAGNAIFELVSEADSETAASLLAKIKREQYEDKLQRYRIENGLTGKSERE